MELRSRVTAPSAASTPPEEGESSAPTESTTSPGPPILSPQVTASEALRIIDAPEIEDTVLLAIADTLISLRAPLSQFPPPLPALASAQLSHLPARARQDSWILHRYGTRSQGISQFYLQCTPRVHPLTE